MKRALMSSIVLLLTLSVGILTRAQAPADADRVVAAMLADTPIVTDLQALVDEIGGRPTGEPANLRSVDWALERFRAIGVEAKKEAFTMPARWSERSASATVGGDVSFSPRIVAMPFSAGTSSEGLTAPLLDGGTGGEADLTRLGDRVKGAWVLVETHELLDIDGLFREYTEAPDDPLRALERRGAGHHRLVGLHAHARRRARQSRHGLLL